MSPLVVVDALQLMQNQLIKIVVPPLFFFQVTAPLMLRYWLHLKGETSVCEQRESRNISYIIYIYELDYRT